MKRGIIEVVMLQERHSSEYVTSKAAMCLHLTELMEYCDLGTVSAQMKIGSDQGV